MKTFAKLHVLLLLLVVCNWGKAQTTFFNEVDYKSAPGSQCLEVISPNSLDRTGWEVHIYDGAGNFEETIDLGGIPPTATVNGHDIIIVDIVMLDDPKGAMAIEDDSDNLIQFLNYGVGTVTAQDGPIIGEVSTNIGVEQITPALSVQLTGTGTDYNDFIWALPGAVNCGAVNITQTLLSILPVDLLYFNAEVKEEHVLTEWATASEHNSMLYYIERSVNGGPFREIHRIDAAGFSDIELYYSFLDRYPPEGQLYYRLTEMDFDGTTMHSDLVTVKNLVDEDLTRIFPVPANNELNVILPAEVEFLTVEVYGLLTGSLLIQERFDTAESQVKINLESLDSGQYMVRLRSANYIHEQRFVKIDMK